MYDTERWSDIPHEWLGLVDGWIKLSGSQMAKVTNSLGSVSRDLFPDALQFLKRWFLQYPDLLFICLFAAETSLPACPTPTL